MEASSPTGAPASRPPISADDLGAVPNLLDRLNIDKLAKQEKTWAGVLRQLVETKLYQQVNGNTIARILLLAWYEEQEKANASNTTASGNQTTERPQTLPTRPGTRTPGR